MYAAILAAILHLMPGPSPAWGETSGGFRHRMELIARSIDAATRTVRTDQRRRLAMAVVVVFWGEGRFAPHVQSGERRGDAGRAICLAQAHQGDLTDVEWLSLAGTDEESTTSCAIVAAQRLKRAWRYCRDLDPTFSWPQAMVLYGTGRTCRSEESHWKNIFVDRGLKWATLVAKH